MQQEGSDFAEEMHAVIYELRKKENGDIGKQQKESHATSNLYTCEPFSLIRGHMKSTKLQY